MLQHAAYLAGVDQLDVEVVHLVNLAMLLAVISPLAAAAAAAAAASTSLPLPLLL